MKSILAICLGLFVAPMTIVAQETDLKVPAEVTPFVASGTKAIALEKSDLNGDGREDFILVLEKEKPARDADDFPVGQRPFLILLRGADGNLTVAKRNERIIMCSQCGGVFGDPFQSLTIERGAIVISHYGGSRDRSDSPSRKAGLVEKSVGDAPGARRIGDPGQQRVPGVG